MPAPPHSLSVVVEWENADRIGAARARLMLAELARQRREVILAGQPELIFVHAGGDSVGETIAEAVAEAGLAGLFSVRFAPSQSGDYYEQKNQGAALARGDLILFLDSDVIPEPGWLANLLSAFEDPAVEVVSGAAIVEVHGLYSAAMALGWFFPLRSESGALAVSRTFWANNVVFRAALFARHPFPATGQHRGQCIVLADRLRREGHVIHIAHGAVVGHPPPEGLGAFVLRAIRRGGDEASALRLAGRAPFWRGTGAIGKASLGALARVWKQRRRVGLGMPGAAAATAIVAANYALQYLGFLGACLAPGSYRRRASRSAS